MYYAMNLPEIIILLFVIFLWLLSIFCFIKRYEKISTIERAGLYNKLDLNTESNQLSTKSLSVDNLKAKTITNFSNTNPTHQITHNTHEFSNALNNHRHVGISASVDNEITNNDKYSELDISKKSIYASQLSKSDGSNLHRSCSEPAVNDAMSNSATHHNINNANNNNTHCISSIHTDMEPLLRAGSIDDKSPPSVLIRNASKRFSDVSYMSPSHKKKLIVNENTFDNFDARPESYPVYADKNVINNINNNNNRQFNYLKPHCDNLLDPNKIPKEIRKSLLDLHRKSVLNLSHNPNKVASSNTTTNIKTNDDTNKQRHNKKIRHSEHFV